MGAKVRIADLGALITDLEAHAAFGLAETQMSPNEK